MKQTIVFVLIVAACIGAVVWLGPSSTVRAQLPSQIELACPQGASPIPGGQTFNQATGKIRQWACIDTSGNVIHVLDSRSTIGGSSSAVLPINLATGVTGILPPANEGSGTPAAGKYVDGGTGAWTAIPATGATEFTLSATVPSAVSLTVACAEGGTGLCNETVFAKAHMLVRLTYNLTQAPVTCSTNAVVAVKDMTSSSILSSITVNQAITQFVDSGALSVATTAGNKILVGTTTAAASCTTFPNVTNIAAVFQ
ncbi:MAG TPA: hypothetical protein VE778_06210 [Candidatus Bathyarchaeia archaeon]|jgi:hypothetical protein|nr:hypothetical protein [Candidatus Bathyarchaeia archaeon]